ncbi:MAG: toll/interleukin-1 receptor domain-containing protein [Pseudomonadota bacterium]
MEFSYDVFISYSTTDRAWADRLKTDLESANLRVFLDHTRIEAGTRWRTELSTAVRESRCLVALWSSHAHGSTWVQKELATFDTHVDMDEQPSARRLVLVGLEGTNFAYDHYQEIRDLREANAYAAGAGSVDQRLWDGMVRKLLGSVRAASNVVQIPVAVLTMTAAETANIRDTTWSLLEQRFGVDRGEVQSRYHGERQDWCPFGGTTSVGDFLSDVVETINQSEGDQKYALEFAEAIDFSDLDSARELKIRIDSSPVAIIAVDPLALDDLQIKQWFGLLSECIARDSTVTLVLPPVPLTDADQALRELIEQKTFPDLESLLNPQLPLEEGFPRHCVLPARDASDIARAVLFGVGHATGRTETTPTSIYIAH